MTKRVLNKLRSNYLISGVLCLLFSPLKKVCVTIARQIQMKVRANGKRVSYGDVDVVFPKGIGILYCSSIYWSGAEGFEPLTWRVLRHFADRTDHFMDVGSNLGLYSVAIGKLRSGVRIDSYEPIPDIYEKNISFHKSNNLPHGHVLNAAISSSDGEAEIYLPLIDDGSMEEQTTATLRQDSWQFEKKHRSYTVPTRSLDSILKQEGVGSKVLMKVDVEDHESGVFKGAQEFLRKVKPVIVCEILPRPHGNQETFLLLDDCGYVAYGLTKDGLVKFSKDDFLGPRCFTDFLLVHSTMAPQLNYISYEDMCRIGWVSGVANG